jgi:hypothetical protein
MYLADTFILLWPEYTTQLAKRSSTRHIIQNSLIAEPDIDVRSSAVRQCCPPESPAPYTLNACSLNNYLLFLVISVSHPCIPRIQGPARPL